MQLQTEEIGIRSKIRDLEKELVLSQVKDTKLKPIVEIILRYEDQKRAIQGVIEKYPELEAVGTQALAALVKATQAAVDAANENQGAVTKLAQSLSDVFVQGIDKSFDALFDTSKNFGERMQSLFAGIGEDMVKQLLHAIITAPLKSTLDTLIKSLSNPDEEGGGLGGLFSGIGGLFGKLFGAIGRLFGAPTPAAHGQFFLPPNHAFAHGGLVLPPNHAFAHGGYVVPDNLLRPFQHGGLVTRGPVMGIVGEAGGEVVAKLKPSGADDWPSGQPVVNVHIAGDVIPKDPQMKPQDVITVSFADMDRGGKLSKAVVNIIKRTR